MSRAVLDCLAFPMHVTPAPLGMVRNASGSRSERRKRILFVHSRKASFIMIDRALLAERWDVVDWYQPGRLTNLPGLVLALLRCDMVFGWFVSWHAFWPIMLARAFRKPSVLVVGGFDTASVPEIGYGFQQGGIRKRLSRAVMARAGRLITNSYSSLREIEQNVGLPADRVTVVYHGVPDPFGSEGAPIRERIALTVGQVIHGNLERKGMRPFVEAASDLPDVRFVLAGSWADDSVELLRAHAPPNVRFTGWISDEELNELYRSASVYVQASRHEGFGLSLAEGMLAGCIPVVTSVGALPEVVGDVGVTVEHPDGVLVADGIRRALEMQPEGRVAARARIVNEFPLEGRRRGVWEVVEGALRNR